MFSFFLFYLHDILISGTGDGGDMNDDDDDGGVGPDSKKFLPSPRYTICFMTVVFLTN